MGYTIIFATACIGLVLVTPVWAVLLIRARAFTVPHLLGPIGTLCAAVPILGAWMPEAFQPLWIAIQLTCAFWLMSFVMIGLAVLLALVLETPRRVRVIAAVCGGLGLLFNAAALGAFMWYATVSPGGV